MGGVALLREHGGNQVSAEMITAAGGHMHGPADLLVLNVASADGEELGAESEFAEFAGDGIGGKLRVVRLNGRRVTLDEFGLHDAAAGDGHQSERSVLILVREGALRALGDEVDLSGRKVGDIRLIAEAEPVALLGFLTVEDETEDMILSLAGELDLDPVGLGDAKAEFLGLDADLVVIDGETA